MVAYPFVPPSAADRFAELVALVRALRAPGGCPWDRAQTLESLRPFVLEETYEVLEAIDRGDRDALRGELGDFIFEAVLLAQLCEEAGSFTVADSLAAITEKLVRRHPHVFGRPADAAPADLPSSPAEVVHRWEALKAQERPGDNAPGAMGDLPKALPALLKAFTIGQRAAAVRFDWPTWEGVLEKVQEELTELRTALGRGEPGPRIEEEIGDLLFTIAHLARQLGVEPESALRRANDKFLRRFAAMERRIAASGRNLRDLSIEELEHEWQSSKMGEREHEDHKDQKDHKDRQREDRGEHLPREHARFTGVEKAPPAGHAHQRPRPSDES